MEEHDYQDREQFAKDVLMMLEKGSLNDVKIKLSDGEIMANKDILIARSEYFATMFKNNQFIEAETSSVDMSHCTVTVMGKIVKFLFSGDVKFSDLSLDQLLKLSHLSELMLLNNFKDEVDEYTTSNVLPKSGDHVKFLPELCSGLKLADHYNLSNIKAVIIEELHYGLKEIPNDVESSDSFKTLSFDLIRETFHFDEGFNLPTTKERYDAFMVWLSKNKVTDEEKFEIVKGFDFEEFTAEELITSVRDSGLYSGQKIDERLLDIFKKQELKLKKQELKLKKKT